MSDKKPRPYKHPQINLRIPEELKAKVQDLAKENNRTMNAEIIHILDKSLSGGDKQYDRKEALDLVQKALDKYEELILNHSDNKHK